MHLESILFYYDNTTYGFKVVINESHWLALSLASGTPTEFDSLPSRTCTMIVDQRLYVQNITEHLELDDDSGPGHLDKPDGV